MTDIYKTIKEAGEGLYKEKGSKFIAFAFPVRFEKEIKEHLAQLHKDYHNARHICYAYKLGYDSNSPFRMNDDGEPSGTAGKPIYGQILSHEITDVLIVVVRYFGGTKLGVSGLVNAYKSAALEAISATDIIENIRTTSFSVNYNFSMMNDAMRLVKDHQLEILEQSYDEACHLTVAVRLSEYERVYAAFEQVYGITIADKKNEM